MGNKKMCENCSKIIAVGRSDKRFCDTVCKNEYHAELRAKDQTEVRRIDAILHRNHRILMQLMAAKIKKLTLPRLDLSEAGFDFNYFTGTYTNSQGKLYHYIYDFAWMEFSTQEVMIVRK